MLGRAEHSRIVTRTRNMAQAGEEPATLVRMRRSGDYIIQDADVYIASRVQRGGWNLIETKWRNQFTPWNCETLEESLEKYEAYVRKNLWHHLIELRGKRLGCWCEDQNKCHGKILIKLLKEYLQTTDV